MSDFEYGQKLRAAAEEYIAGCEARAEENQLSDRRLAVKFECSRRAICRVLEGLDVPGLSADECRLIVACAKERDRLASVSPYRSKDQIAKIHKISVQALDAQLWMMDWVNPLTSRKKGVAA